MNATWLSSLFPRTWRDRHEPAFRGELERRSATFVDVLDVGLGALDAHLRADDAAGESIPGRPPAGIAGQRPSQAWMSVLLGHVVVFLVVNAILTAINLLTDRSTLWALYPMWGWGSSCCSTSG
ncbi:MAG TPA: 2TM domain-containing protein [Thermomicrobiales bacterium]|nr:2TM domain-containing protein [Thermomicrobiales bacterium]